MSLFVFAILMLLWSPLSDQVRQGSCKWKKWNFNESRPCWSISITSQWKNLYSESVSCSTCSTWEDSSDRYSYDIVMTLPAMGNSELILGLISGVFFYGWSSAAESRCQDWIFILKSSQRFLVDSGNFRAFTCCCCLFARLLHLLRLKCY